MFQDKEMNSIEKSFQEYRADVLRTWIVRENNEEHAKLGVLSEVGEVADLFKKCIQKGHVLDKHAYFDELGDVIFYLCALNSDKEYDTDALKYDLINALGGTGPTTGLHSISSAALEHFRAILSDWEGSLHCAMAINIVKRKERFPNGFTVNERK